MQEKSIIICASGNSIPFLNSQYYNSGFKSGLDYKLSQIIKNNFSMGLNYFSKYGCETTFTVFCDWQFYIDNYKWLKNHPLIIGRKDASLKNLLHQNTILLPWVKNYDKENFWTKGLYYQQVSGVFAISLAIALGFKTIYSLGMDACEVNGQTHFYQGVADLNKKTDVYVKNVKRNERLHYRGVGKKADGKYKTSTYNYPDKLNNDWFAPFLQEKDIQIFNVSQESKITIFPKLTYKEFYEKMNNSVVFKENQLPYIRDIILQNKQ